MQDGEADDASQVAGPNTHLMMSEAGKLSRQLFYARRWPQPKKLSSRSAILSTRNWKMTTSQLWDRPKSCMQSRITCPRRPERSGPPRHAYTVTYELTDWFRTAFKASVGVKQKNSSDLSSGRRPTSKSTEFFLCSHLCIEIGPPQLFDFSKNMVSLWEHDSPANTPLCCRSRIKRDRHENI